MNRSLLSHLLFGASIAALVALGAWWTVYIARSVEFEHSAHENALRYTAQVTALHVGHGDIPAIVQELPGPSPLQIIPVAERTEGDLSYVALPDHPELAVRPAPAMLSFLKERMQRRWLMVRGEGSLLFALLTIMTTMLWTMVRQERRHMTGMEDFVSAVTHEMKTPLAGMKSLLQTLAAGRVPEAMKVRLYTMGLKEADKLEHSIENVLVAGSLRTERIGVSVERQALRPLLDAFVAHRVRTLVDRPDAIRLVWEIPDTDTEVHMDPDLVRIILENLADNGFKYGGEEPVVIVRARREGNRALVSVEDKGIGFSTVEARHLFIPYRRFTGARRNTIHGTGLGLSISKALAARLGGDLTARSDGPGQGSAFTLHLRVAI